MEDKVKLLYQNPFKQNGNQRILLFKSSCLQMILNPSWYDTDRFVGTTHGT